MEEIVTMLMFELQQNIADNVGTVDYVRYEAKMLSVLQNLQQTPCTAMRESLLLMHSREFDAWSHATNEADIERIGKNLKTIVATVKAIDACQPVS